MKQEIRKYPDGRVLALTGECPKGFKDSIYAGWTGTPDCLKETVVAVGHLPPLADDISDEWKDALRSKGFKFEDEPAEPARDHYTVYEECPGHSEVMAIRIMMGTFCLFGFLCFVVAYFVT